MEMNVLKVFVNEWLPPVIARWVRQHRGKGVYFEGDFASWEQASSQCSGYDAKEILAKVLDSTIKVKCGEAAFERDSVLFDQIEYVWPVLSGLMWAAASNGGRLNVLDFGGALGSSYFQNRNFLKSLTELRWNVIEQEHYVNSGQAHIQDKQIRFYKTIEDCMSENQPNVVLLSSVLQYLKYPFDIMKSISMIKAKIMIIDRTPFSTHNLDTIMVQQVPESIYPASYPMWVFSKKAFMNLINEDWLLLAFTPCPEGEVKSKSGYKFSFQGMLLESCH